MHYDQPTQPVEFVYEPAQQPKRGCLRSCFSRMVFLLLLGMTAIVFVGVGIAGIFTYNTLSRDIEDGIAKLEAARTRETFETTRIMDRNGELLWEFFGEGKRTAIPYAQMPQSLIEATVAVEDDSFFENDGFDLPALIAALIANFRNPDSRPVGGSTITQQIVRHIVFDYEERVAVSYNRKAKELILSYIMSQEFSKEEILEMYLNEIYYGNLAYGIEAAAQTYFGKSATNLTQAESALLAGLPQSPIELDPITHLEAAKQRQWVVLNLMSGDGKISQAEAEAVYLQELTFANQEVSLTAPPFCHLCATTAGRNVWGRCGRQRRFASDHHARPKIPTACRTNRHPTRGGAGKQQQPDQCVAGGDETRNGRNFSHVGQCRLS